MKTDNVILILGTIGLVALSALLESTSRNNDVEKWHTKALIELYDGGTVIRTWKADPVKCSNNMCSFIDPTTNRRIRISGTIVITSLDWRDPLTK